MCNVIFHRFPSHTISVDAKRSEKQKVIQDLREKLMNKELEGRLIYFVSLPEESVHFESDDEVKELQMTDCDHCHQWYHRSCLAVADYVFKQKKQILVLF